MGRGGRGGRRRGFFVALLATAGLLAVTILVSSASTSTPVLTITKGDTGYKVAWTYSSSHAAQDLELEIDRGPDPQHFTEWARVRSPERNSWRYDRKPLEGASYYRARLWVRDKPQDWGPIVGVNVPPTTTTASTTSTTTTSTTSTTIKPLGTTTTVKATTTTKPAPPANACTTSRADVLFEINQIRLWFHVPALKANGQLDGAAQTHVWYMYYAGSVTHGPGGDPPLWVKEITDKGYKPFAALGQNLGGGMNNAHDLVSAWVGSKVGHLETMLNKDFIDLGIGCFKNTTGKGWPWYWAADFGRHS